MISDYTHKGEGESGPEVTTGLLRRAKGRSQLRKWCSVLEVREAGAPFWDEAELKADEVVEILAELERYLPRLHV